VIFYQVEDDLLGSFTSVQGVTPGGYAIVRGSQTSAHFCAAGLVKFAGDAITRIDAGLTLDEAHTALTDGLTKAELVALGDDLGLTLSDSSLKAELLADIRAHLEGLS
jgi:hypothetical protein